MKIMKTTIALCIMPEDAKMTVQDRAYTSPVWYTPAD